MTEKPALLQLNEIQRRVRELVIGSDKYTYRAMFHPDLSPIGWHFGHCLFVENYWLREVIQLDTKSTADDHPLYFPENIARRKRGALIKDLELSLEDALIQQLENSQFLRLSNEDTTGHELLRNEYIQHFLIQHYSQHYETMLMVKTQQAIQQDECTFIVENPLRATTPDNKTINLQTGNYPIGGTRPNSYDNELPKHDVAINSINIASHPVTNSEYLMFMESGAYNTPSLWSQDGWLWVNNAVSHPDHWKTDSNGLWYGINENGAFRLMPDDPVSGVSYYEACAYVNWVQQYVNGACLPHETEWEAAANNNLLLSTGIVWEWCRNTFYAYEDFTSFPYSEYSTPWFDGKHYTLKGGSVHTQPAIIRTSFRNFYTADKRHIFAGIRLACKLQL